MTDTMISVHDSFERPDPALINAFRDLPVATISDVLGPGHLLAPRIRPMGRDVHMVGSALTLQLPPGDNLGMHLAVRLARPGEVIIADQAGTQLGAPVGEIIATAAQAKGVAGIVLDGVVRDVAQLRRMPMPVFAIGVWAQQCAKHGPARVGHPVVCAGVRVAPGDIIVGDDDGVVVIPTARAAEVVDGVRHRLAAESRRLAAIADGKLYPDWLPELLSKKGWPPAG